jgi:hypothetical protein
MGALGSLVGALLAARYGQGQIYDSRIAGAEEAGF